MTVGSPYIYRFENGMRYLFTVLLTFVFLTVCGQRTIAGVLDRYNSGAVDYITVAELTQITPILLDAREQEEFEVSHLEGAIWSGHKTFSMDSIQNRIPNKHSPIVVYCSIGVRSEDIAQKLVKAGYTDVSNLYGGIFQWKIDGNPVYDSTGVQTEKVHAFSKYWGKLLPNAEKVFKTKPKDID